MNKQKFYSWLFYLLPIIYFLSLPILTGDLAVWVAHGKYFLLHGEILRHDIFSVLPTKPLIYPVGICVVYALAYSLFGLIGVSLFHKFILLIFLFIWKSSLDKLKSLWTYPSFLLVFCAFFGSSMFWVDRPAFVGMLPLLLTYLILEKTEEINWNDIFRLNLINIFWVNVHGSWLLLIGMYIWREISRKIFLQKRLSWQQLVAVLTFILSSLINPFGYKIFSYVFLTSSLSKKRLIPEWAAPTFSGPFQSQTIIYFLLVILMLGYGIYLFKKNRSQLNTILTSPFVPLAFLGLQSIRNTALPFFVVIPFACHFLFEQGKQVNQTEKKSFLNLIIVGFACLVGIAFLPMVKPYVRDFLPENKKEVFEKTTPVNIAKFLNQTKDSDPVFNAWEFGSYFTLEQKHPIFIDTRNIIFTDEEFEECLKIIETRNDWELVLSKYKVRYIALNRKESGHLISVLNHSSNWENVLMDDESILFQKK